MVVRAHQPCDDCGSRDALAIYSDGHTYCFSCEKARYPEGDEPISFQEKEKDQTLVAGRPEALAKRGITEETCRLWSYHRGEFGGRNGVHIANYLDENRNRVAQKIRLPDKKFPWKGDRKEFKGLYGQWLWSGSTARKVVITEGEIDAMSVSQVQNHRGSVDSLVDGAGSAERGIKEALDWLEGFDDVILMFDNDEPGKKAVEKVKFLFSPGKLKIAQFPDDIKDANEALTKGRSKAIINAIWGAKPFKPDGLVSGDEIIDRLLNRPDVTSYPYPEFMVGMNSKTYGIRLGELDTWTSGSGMGKTTVIKALQHHYFETTEFNQCLIHLEEPLEDTAESLIGYDMGKRIGLPDVREKTSKADIEASARHLFGSKDTQGNSRFQLYDAFGSMGEDDNLYALIRFAAKAQDCKIFWLDHLSILVSDTDANEDERRRIDRLMHNLKSLTIELGIYIGLISHLKKAPQGKSFEEGYIPSLDDLRGSGSIKQLSNSVYALARNQQHKHEEARNTSIVVVLKCRYTGRTGTADFLLFVDETGRLDKGRNPDDYDGFYDESDPNESDDFEY